MSTKGFYTFLLFSSIALATLGAATGCYTILKSKEETKNQAIERSFLAYLNRPAYQFKTAIMKNDVSMAIDLLHQEGFDPNHPYCKEHNAKHLPEEALLIEVVRFNRGEILKEMLKYPLDIFVIGQTGRTPIEESVFLDNPLLLDMLLKKANLDINAIYHNTSETLLHLAIRYQAENVINYLIQKGANPMSPNEQGILAIDYLTEQSQKDILLQKYQSLQRQKKTIEQMEEQLNTPQNKKTPSSPQEENEYRLKINAFMKMVGKEPDSSDAKRTQKE